MAIGMATYDVELDEKAEVLSEGYYFSNRYILSYRYENAKGHRFLVLNVNTRQNATSMLSHYARGRQIADNIPWLSGNKLPAYVYGHPSLYMQCKENEKAMAVGLWNFFADIAIDPVAKLDKAYKDIKFINCSGKLENDKVYLSDIAPFAFAGFVVFKD